MEKKNFSDLYDEYKKVVDDITEIFVKKNFEEDTELSDYEYRWVTDNGQVLEIGDYYFDFEDILTDLKENTPKEEIFNWYNYDLECRELEMTTLNYRSWLHGAPRHSEETMNKVRKLHDNVLKAQSELDIALMEYNEKPLF